MSVGSVYHKRSIEKEHDGVPSNGLPITRAAPIERDEILSRSDAQNSPDLVDAQRRRVHGRVGPALGIGFRIRIFKPG
jgi:hypothetical protein